MEQKQILIVDDDHAVLTSLALLLKQGGYAPITALTPDTALERLSQNVIDLVIQDMNYSRRTSGDEGMDLLRRIKARYPHLPVILMTAWASVELAVKGVKAGAADFITKPWTHEQIHLAVRTALGLARVNQTRPDETPARATLDADHDFRALVGEDPQFLRVLEIIGRVAATEAPVLITGESGTGKEVVAEALWKNSDRRAGPWVKVNLGGVPTSLFESEMFGHVKGAFTDAKHSRTGRFEAADGGTLFLDEVGDLDAACQVKLLRVLQDRTFERVGSSTSTSADVRIISATNRDLASLIDSGRFREDLLYRLNLISVHLPPLRERRGDIPLLAARFLDGLARVYRRHELRLGETAFDWLGVQPWSGNVRQLKHLIERTVLLTNSDQLGADEFIRASRTALEGPAPVSPEPPPTTPSSEPQTLDQVEKRFIVEAIARHDGNLTRVAQELGLSRGSLYRRLEKHGIEL